MIEIYFHKKKKKKKWGFGGNKNDLQRTTVKAVKPRLV